MRNPQAINKETCELLNFFFIGVQNIENCSAHEKIPIFLITSGAVVIILGLSLSRDFCIKESPKKLSKIFAVITIGVQLWGSHVVFREKIRYRMYTCKLSYDFAYGVLMTFWVILIIVIGTICKMKC